MDKKAELIKRYCYIYENAEYILAPYILERKYSDVRGNKRLKSVFNFSVVEVREMPYELLHDLESFSLSDIPCEESKFYLDLEKMKSNPEYLDKVQKGLELLKEINNKIYNPVLRTKLNAWSVFSKIKAFIEGQRFDRYNKHDKLLALDQYFNIARYKNDGKVWHSGYETTFLDYKNEQHTFCFTYQEPAYPRETNDAGVEANKFIDYLINEKNFNEENNVILTEEEKQKIYLKYHDELPWNLEGKCEFEEEVIPLLTELRLSRPEHTSPCGENFSIKEEEIFVNPDSPLYRYYQICPHCGYMVNIPKKILSEGVKERIEARCEKDPNLFRKMYLYSELFALEKDTPDNGKRLLKTRKSNQ